MKRAANQDCRSTFVEVGKARVVGNGSEMDGTSSLATRYFPMPAHHLPADSPKR